MSLESFVEEARRIVGPRWVLVETWSLAGYAIDYWPLLVYRALRDPRGALSRGPAAAVLPGSEEEVAALLEAAQRFGVRLAVYAGGSGVLGGAVPDEGWVVLDVARLDWVDWFDEEAGIVDAGAGAPLAEVEGWLNRRGWTLRHYPQSLPEARIGGLVATRSTGQYSTGYGGIEERVKGLHAAVPGVGLVRVKPSPRRSVLPPLEQLFTGSEGLLGVITRVYLEALPLPECELRVHWRPGSFREALGEARSLAQRRLAPDLYRIYDEQEAPVALGVEGPAAIGVYEGPCRVARARLEAAAELISSRVEVEEGEGPASRWLRERFNVIASIARLLEIGLAFDTIEFSAPWGSAARVYEAARSAALSVEGVAYVGVHASHFYPSGVALYMTFAFDAGRLEEVYGAVWDRVMRAVSSAGGSISHHHGIGRMRLPYLKLELGEEGARLVARIKRALDPQGILRGFPL
ncbi:MAG: FAD-binding oxidoreductase [Desulfurococcales archaeon]|nr:FAD-binding oxidoreductase [Desulfurococcales archaeon]